MFTAVKDDAVCLVVLKRLDVRRAAVCVPGWNVSDTSSYASNVQAALEIAQSDMYSRRGYSVPASYRFPMPMAMNVPRQAMHAVQGCCRRCSGSVSTLIRGCF